jgi:putative membrane protein
VSVGSFAAGWLIAAIALLSPIARLSEILFSVHMTQHTLLMLVAAPLIAFGQPLLVSLWALPPERRDRVASIVRREGVVLAWRRISAPLTAFLIQAIALWIWHLPVLYEAALAHEGVHAVQHLSFVLAASMFWWTMVHGRYGRQGYGIAVVYVFLTAMHSGALGALLAIAPSPWYPHYVHQATASRIDVLADQQLAGLLMWIPAGVVLIVLGLALFAAWMGETERRVRLGATDAASR